MLRRRNTSYLSPMCCNFWERFINSHKICQGCSTSLNHVFSSCHFIPFAWLVCEKKLLVRVCLLCSCTISDLANFGCLQGNFWKIIFILEQMSEKLKNGIRYFVGQAVLELLIKKYFACFDHLIRNHLAYRPFSHCIDQAGLGAFTAKSGRKHYNPPPLTVMWMNFDSPNFPSFCSLSAIISFQTCSNKCILYVLSFHKCIKIKYKMVNMYGVFRD